MFTKKTVYTDSFNQEMKKLPTVQQIIAVIANVGDEVHILEWADERDYYEEKELEFYITKKGADMYPSTDKDDVLDVLHFPVVDVYGKELDPDTKCFRWHIVFSTAEDD